MKLGRAKKGNDGGLGGTLNDLGLPDLFQLLGQQQKTGILHLAEGKKSVQVFFDQGMVVGTAFPGQEKESPLGSRLMRGRLISREKWETALRKQKEDLISVEQVLVNEGGVSREDITSALRLITFETLYSLFRWTEGTFRFEAKQVFYDANFVEPLKAEYLLLDLLRMVDEWPMLAERVPHFGIVFRKADPRTTLDALIGTSWENQRSFQMEVIFELINGQRTVQEIMDEGFAGEFDTCKILSTLMDAGLIEASTIELGREKGMKLSRPARSLPDMAGYLIVGLLGVFFLYQVAIARGGQFPFTQAESRGWNVMRVALQKAKERQEENARQVFFVEENRYPLPSESPKKAGGN